MDRDLLENIRNRYIAYKLQAKILSFLLVFIAVGAAVLFWPRDQYWISQGKFPPMTRLMLAASDGDNDRVVELLQSGAVINETTTLGANALFFSIYRHNYDTAELLLSRGASPNLNENNVAWMIINPAQRGEKEFLVRLLTDLDDNNHGYRIAIKFLVEACDANALETLLGSMDENAKWGVIIAEQYFDNSADCYAELVDLVNRYRE